MPNIFDTRKGSDLYMSFAVVRMQKMKSHDLKGIQFHNQRERKSLTNDDIDEERSHENYDFQNDKNINYNERVKDIIDSQKTGTRKTRKDAVLVNELLITSDKNFFENLNADEQKRFFEESYKLLSDRYGKQNVAYATVHNDEKTPHMHMGIVPMRDGKLQGKNVFNRQELLWLQDKFPKHMQELGFDLKRGERGSDRKHMETREFKKHMLEKDIDLLEKKLSEKKNELETFNENVTENIEIPIKHEYKNVEFETDKKNIFGKPKTITKKQKTGNVIVSKNEMHKLVTAARDNKVLKSKMNHLLKADVYKENEQLKSENKILKIDNKHLQEKNSELEATNYVLKSNNKHLRNELEKVYQTTKDFLKERTNDLQAFKTVFGSWVNKVKEKLPKGVFSDIHAKAEKKKMFSMENVSELNQEVQKQKSVKKRSMDLER